MGNFQNTEVTWLGHSTFQFKSPGGKVVLIDPWLNENPSAQISAEDIDHVDIIALTHGHFDHFGDTVSIAKRTGATVVSIFEISQYLGRQGIAEDQIIGMNIGGTVDVDGIKFTMVRAVHSSGVSGEESIVDGGDPAGFVITFENGFTVYHTGDTDLFGDMKYVGELHEPDLMLTCIGDHFTMGPKAAAKSVELVKPQHVIPMHYGTFPLLTGTPEELVNNLSGTLKDAVITAEIGTPLN
ncbi:MAG: metal-dependent hydrolase [Candidatus Marinimicrobia bacterium]|nr:metal-dependent hydrolase [Candidatus Neomarinimicrobiota bacterium]MCF7828629.1 metal-dependent hydrolase [Candidatus Neomarinimicrobiota bacterium]MCF7880370.1 metal-dependent hydrolase [Candidatus Neomarinimicrobiota bacterium]